MSNKPITLKRLFIGAAIGVLILGYLALFSHPTEKAISKAAPASALDSAPTPKVEATSVTHESEILSADNRFQQSPSGNFLAGIHAQAVGENRKALSYYDKTTEDQSLATATLYGRMYLLSLTEGSLDKALKSLNKAEGLGSKAPLSILARTAAAFKAGQYDNVKKLLNHDENGISRLLSPTLLAWAEVGNGNVAAAMSGFVPIKNTKQFTPMSILHTALINDVAGKPEAAAQKYLELQKLTGLSLRSIELMGRNLERQGQAQKAMALYKQLGAEAEAEILTHQATIRLSAKTPPPLDIDTPRKGAAEAIYGISTALLGQGNWESALALANMALYLRPDFPAASLVKAGALAQNNRISEANEIYKSIPDSSPLSWTAQLQLASNFDRIGQTEKSIKLLRVMADKHPTRERPLIEMGDILRGHERFAEAIGPYDDALKRAEPKNPALWVVYYARGIAYEQTKQWPKAEADFLTALTLQPNHPLILNYLGYSWVDQGLHLKRALGMISKAVELRPRDGYIVDSLGWGLYKTGNYPKAVKRLERAVMLRPADPLINDHLGDALWQVGRQREAKFQWQRSLDLDPKSEIADIVRQKLKTGLPTVNPTPKAH